AILCALVRLPFAKNRVTTFCNGRELTSNRRTRRLSPQFPKKKRRRKKFTYENLLRQGFAAPISGRQEIRHHWIWQPGSWSCQQIEGFRPRCSRRPLSREPVVEQSGKRRPASAKHVEGRSRGGRHYDAGAG